MSGKPSGLDLAGLIAGLGFEAPADAARARGALESAGLTRAGKQRIDAAKLPAIEALLDATFLVTCGAPQCGAATDGRALVVAANRSKCRVCGGSQNRRAVDLLEEALQRAGVRKIVVVGGSPAVHEELRRAAPARWDLRLVEGTGRRTSDAARADVRWADLVLIWGSSELDHKVSELYVAARSPGMDHVVRASRRGIAALLETAREWASRRPARKAQ